MLSTEEAARIRDIFLAAPARTTVSGPDKPAADPEQVLSHESLAWGDA